MEFLLFATESMEQAVRIGGGWNWLRIVFSGGLRY
jgi:hypothetical protein